MKLKLYTCAGCNKRFRNFNVIRNYWGEGYLCRKCTGVDFSGRCEVCNKSLSPNRNDDMCLLCGRDSVSALNRS